LLGLPQDTHGHQGTYKNGDSKLHHKTPKKISDPGSSKIMKRIYRTAALRGGWLALKCNHCQFNQPLDALSIGAILALCP
jgi:hypothetical protein